MQIQAFGFKRVFDCVAFSSPPNLGGAALEVVGCLYFALVSPSGTDGAFVFFL